MCGHSPLFLQLLLTITTTQKVFHTIVILILFLRKKIRETECTLSHLKKKQFFKKINKRRGHNIVIYMYCRVSTIRNRLDQVG